MRMHQSTNNDTQRTEDDSTAKKTKWKFIGKQIVECKELLPSRLNNMVFSEDVTTGKFVNKWLAVP